MADIGTYLLFWAEIVPYIVLSLCSFKQEQATARKIMSEIKSGTNVLRWDTVVKQAAGQDTGLRAQELVQRHLELDLRNLHMNWEAVIVGHVDMATMSGRFDSLRWKPCGHPTSASAWNWIVKIANTDSGNH
jgi:hypothetical protein